MELSKDLKKIMISGAALLMFASVSTSVNSVNVSARHVRTNRVRKHSHKYNFKRSNNLGKAYNRRFKIFKKLLGYHDKNWTKNYKKIAKINKQTYYQGYDKVHNKAYQQGYRDGNGATNNKDPYNFFDIKYKNSKQYKNGFVTAFQYSNLFRPCSHKRALSLYNINKKDYGQQETKDWVVKHNPKSANYFGTTF